MNVGALLQSKSADKMRVAERRADLAAILAVAGIAGPILFTLAFIVQGLLRDGYSHISQPVSALATGPNGWVQDTNFFVFGSLMVVFAVALHLGVRPARRGAAGPALLAVSGIGLLLAGAFPARDASGAFNLGPGHVTGAFLAFLGAGTGLIAISRRLTRDPNWRGVSAYTLMSGIVVVVLFLLTGRIAVPEDAPLHDFTGLMQRAVVAVWFSCIVVLGLRLRHVIRSSAS